MKAIQVFIFSISLFVYVAAFGASEFLPTSTPESQGIPSKAILEFVQAAEKNPDHAAHSLIIIRNGHVVAEGYWRPYAIDQPHELFSLSKSFTSTAVGLAVDQGLLQIDDRVVDFFPELTPENAPWKMKNMRVRQLLTMSTGHMVEPELFPPPSDEPLAKLFLESEPELDPGKYFLYNTPATYMQSAIVQKLTGQSVRDYLMPRLFEPLGIDKPRWDQCADGINFGGFGLYLKTRDIAKFGQLLLQKGKWNGKQLIPQSWLALATTKQVSNGASPESDWNNGYGFQFWMNATEGFRGDGAFGQLCVVLPKANMVVAMTAATRDMQEEMRWIWNILLPVLSDEALPNNTGEQAELRMKLQSLTLKTPAGDAEPDFKAVVNNGVYVLDENTIGLQSLNARLEGNKIVLDIVTETGRYTLPTGTEKWNATKFIRTSMFDAFEESKAYTASAWESPTTLNLNIVYEGRCRMLRLKITFGDEILVQPSVNVSFGPPDIETIKGNRKPN